MKLNHHYEKLEESYLFSTVARKVAAFQAEHPEADVIRMGIGDVTRPLCTSVDMALVDAAQEQGKAETFHGYGPEQGYDFLREAIAGYYQNNIGADVNAEDIFISDGAKSDLGNILDLFDADNTVLIPDPVYPVYQDTNVMDGRRIVYMQANRENGFLPMPVEGQQADLIYLCSPNNPTGAAYNRDQLTKWVRYAASQDALILFDAAYEAFVQEDLPRSIFEIPGARSCAIEFCSLSKTAGFTGTRCGYTVVPKDLSREGLSLHSMWLRRQTTKFNGVSYPVQRAAAEVFTEAGMKGCKVNLAVYQENAKRMTETLTEMGIWHTGGTNSPYIWMQCPGGMSSWEFFDDLLQKTGIVGTPGSGFGRNGEGFFRLTAFGSMQDTREAMERLKRVYGVSFVEIVDAKAIGFPTNSMI